MKKGTAAKKGTAEQRRLAALRARVGEVLDERTSSGAYVALFNEPGAKALSLFERKKGDFWGHRSFQAVQPFAGRAIATFKAGKPDKKVLARCRELGLFYEGGSAEGHALALHGLLGRYDRLEDHPALPTAANGLDDDLRARIEARNKLLRDGVRPDAELQLSLLVGEPVSSKRYKDDGVDHGLAGEAALRAGDVPEAARRFRKMEGFTPSWYSAFAGLGDPRGQGSLGRARVARAQGAHALVLKHCQSSLEQDPQNAQALLLAAATASKLRFKDRALGYLKQLRKHHPLRDVVVDGITLLEVEQQLDKPDLKRLAADEGEAALASGDHEAAAAALGRVLGKGRLKLEGRALELVPQWLYALAASGQHEALREAGHRASSSAHGLVSAREALAWAYGKLKQRSVGKDYFASSGLAELFEERRTYADWLKLPVEAALSPLPVTASERAETLIIKGANAAAYAVFEKSDAKLAETDPLRFLLAGAAHREGIGKASKAQRRKAAERAWRWLAPLAKTNPASNPYRIETAVVGIIELLGILGKHQLVRAAVADPPAKVVSVSVPDEVRSYPSLTKRAYARLLPCLLDAWLELGEPDKVIEHLEAYFGDKGKHERNNRRLLERLDRALAAVGGERLPKQQLEASVEHGNEIARRLQDEAWALEQRGEAHYDAAIERYLQSAEADPSICAIGLGNAGNLLSMTRAFKRAWPLLEAALIFSAGFPPASRAGVLAQAGRWFRDQKRWADALPLCALSFELAPTAERAAELAQCYVGVGDHARAARACAHGSRLEPRHPRFVAPPTGSR